MSITSKWASTILRSHIWLYLGVGGLELYEASSQPKTFPRYPCVLHLLSDYGFREHRVRYIHRVKAFAGIKGHREINQDVFLDQETRDQHPVQEPTTPGVPGKLVWSTWPGFLQQYFDHVSQNALGSETIPNSLNVIRRIEPFWVRGWFLFPVRCKHRLSWRQMAWNIAG
jgi:hypothetical protein